MFVACCDRTMRNAKLSVPLAKPRVVNLFVEDRRKKRAEQEARRKAEIMTIGDVVSAWRRKLNAAKREEARRNALPMPKWAADIVCEVADRSGADEQEIMAPGNVRKHVAARSEIFYRLYAKKNEHERISMPMIGRWFSRDHTTILHAIARYSEDTGLPRLSGFQIQERKRQMAKYWKHYDRRQGSTGDAR